MDKKRKTVIITGGAKRLGKEIALYFARQNYNIALHYFQSKDSAENVKQEFETLGVEVQLFYCDLSKINDITVLFKQIQTKFDTIEILINNASIFFKEEFLSNSIEDVQNTLAINFISPYLLSQEFAKHINNGHIINILDTKIKQLESQYFLYSLSKKMLKDLTLMSAKALAPNIRVNGICPGHIIMEEKNEMSHLKQKPENIPLKRNGYPGEIITALDFLIHQSFITGQLLFIDGGEHLL